MAHVDEAEKEASEVLHSLLSVERIEKTEVILDDDNEHSPSSQSFQAAGTNGSNNNVVNEGETQLHWTTPVALTAHSIFSAIDGTTTFTQNQIDEQQVVIWEGHAIQVEPDNTHINTLYATSSLETGEEMLSPKRETPSSTTTIPSPPRSSTTTKTKTLTKAGTSKSKKQPAVINNKKKKKNNTEPLSTNENTSNVGSSVGNESTKLEESAQQVKERFKRGCECQDESCFRGLNPESVYKHRLNIAELTKGEHDMYLMGVTMACLANPDTTVRHKERRRLRAQYVYQGRRVCLDAFLYLENCTHYQLKRIRKHVMTHGVAPRVHGNHGKKPHNTFPLDIYYHATEFLKQYLEQYTGERDIVNTKQPIQLPWDVTRKNLHDAYKEYGQILEPGIKLMGYSTFRHFMKEQFPHVKFCKVEPKTQTISINAQTSSQIQQQNDNQIQNQSKQNQIQRTRDTQLTKCVINNEVQQVIPLVVAQSNDGSCGQHQQTFLVTPVSQLISNSSSQNGTDVTNSDGGGGGANNSNAPTYSYQFANTGYLINEQGNIVTTMANANQHHSSYTFNRM